MFAESKSHPSCSAQAHVPEASVRRGLAGIPPWAGRGWGTLSEAPRGKAGLGSSVPSSIA